MSTCDIGLIGLGTMGAALALNIAEKGFRIAVFNRTAEVTQRFVAEAGPLADRIVATDSLEAFAAALKPPRAAILMVPAGPVVDDQMTHLSRYLSAGDLMIDAGNANFHDTNRRAGSMEPLRFLGLGVSGGEEGARHGPSIMAGGAREDWDRVAPIFTAIAAQYEGTPCAAWLGEDGAGHFVKTVHNGIEYADMQMIAECYGLMRDGLDLTAAQIGDVFAEWNAGPLSSYLIEITADVARTTENGIPMLDLIVDAAGQKGTGRWTAIEAQHLAAPVSVIEAAVAARNLSARRDARAEGEALFGPGSGPVTDLPMRRLEQALMAGKILCYAQGFSMIRAAAEQFGWSLPLPEIARVWRAGCIIRSAMLDDMAAALEQDGTRDLMVAPHFAGLLKDTHEALREVVAHAALHGHAVPALSAALAHFDTMRTARGTANMIQGQRDFFGRHGFVRLDTGESDQHGPW